jgi:hypothetical protein
MGEWISVDDELPEVGEGDDGRVLGWAKRRDGWYQINIFRYFPSLEKFNDDRVKMWQPLPEPPETDT